MANNHKPTQNQRVLDYINEMAKEMCEDCAKDEEPCRVAQSGEMCDSVREQAETLYNAGYRKQSEGEWKQTTEPLGAHNVDCVECSACGESWVLDEEFDFDVVNDFWYFCPNCGARMKGEEDEKSD